ncbi:DUF4142 domain-containing protein [Hymenobacter metallicola]|uniref:DUF4142 domain-containing protein n=1 Tax=Hymenobacter metallicola TaxID=2563114 RepID=A0A4Z0QCN7_9BACT|nr:DUF4142 domain-containing protein [Hymenobacter metallicola]TGE26472.1 DUF4142 domain-containing protein [Hymenobacter metallicola]
MRYCLHILSLTASLLLGACSPDSGQKDPVAEAQFQNEKRIGDQNVTEKQERDAEFMVKAASNGMLEVELSKLAQQKATHPAIKNFAQQMITHHSEANAALRTLAEQKGLVLPQGLGRDQQETYRQLASLAGPQFEKQYITAMVDAHKQDVDEFEDMSEDAYDGDIRGLAAKYAPILDQHLEMARQAEDQVANLP